MGRDTKAKHLILTHFSARFPKVAPISDKTVKEKAMIAFDHLRLEVKSLEWSHEFVEIYRQLIHNDNVSNDE